MNQPEEGYDSGTSASSPEAEVLEAEGPGELSREQQEREAAWRRGEERAARQDSSAQSLRQLQERFSERGVPIPWFVALAESVRDYAIFLMDPDGIIIYWGEGARLIKWWTREQIEGGHLRLLYLDGGSEDGTAEDHLKTAAESGEYTGEGQRVRSDGSTFWAGVSLTALRDPEGNLMGFAKVARDLTARHAVEAALQAARDSAEELRTSRAGEEENQRKAEFLTTLSHEIRTPVNAVLGYADLLEMTGSENFTEDQRTYIQRIRSSSKHLLELVNHVLDLSRIEADRMPVGATVSRIRSAVEGAVALVEPQARAKNLLLRDEVSGFVAETPYYGDEARVRQILVNLLGNAVKFTPPAGRVTLSAGTAAQPSPDAELQGPGPWAWLRIEDTGPGIPPDRLKAIFEPYEQADMSAGGRQVGTGLGITISKRLARLMHGDITVRSEVGRGTSFFLWLPAGPKL